MVDPDGSTDLGNIDRFGVGGAGSFFLEGEFGQLILRGATLRSSKTLIRVVGRTPSAPPRGRSPVSNLAEGVGFEPTVSCPTHAFQACRFGRSRIPPYEPAAECTVDVEALDRSGDAPATLPTRTVLGGEPVVPCTPNPRYGGLNPCSRPEPPLGNATRRWCR